MIFHSESRQLSDSFQGHVKEILKEKEKKKEIQCFSNFYVKYKLNIIIENFNMQNNLSNLVNTTIM